VRCDESCIHSLLPAATARCLYFAAPGSRIGSDVSFRLGSASRSGEQGGRIAGVDRRGEEGRDVLLLPQRQGRTMGSVAMALRSWIVDRGSKAASGAERREAFLH
jgi:hypothetical protein